MFYCTTSQQTNNIFLSQYFSVSQILAKLSIAVTSPLANIKGTEMGEVSRSCKHKALKWVRCVGDGGADLEIFLVA
jgi:hypothetical protein